MTKTFITADTIATRHVDVLVWIMGNRKTNEFAESLAKQFAKFKQLSEGQINAVKAKLAPKAPAVGTDVGAGLQQITTAFASALESGIQKPKLRLGDFRFSPAKPEGKNPGAIYVKAGGEYMGKIADAKFYPVKACSDAQRAEIVATASSPKEAAIAYGKKTGCCACCGRELTDPTSVEMGIGPICASKYFG
ncbi:MAG TPA: DUF6011 domain-containing protein [Noviherbaspirillum sp.]